MRIYLDACCLNRLTDDHGQPRVRGEAEAVEAVLRLVRAGKAVWVSSTTLEVEINRNPDMERRHDVNALLEFADERVVPGPDAAERAAFLHALGFGTYDALHLACAEQASADVFLTTDDDLIRRAARYKNQLHIIVQNPVFWYQEVAL